MPKIRLLTGAISLAALIRISSPTAAAMGTQQNAVPPPDSGFTLVLIPPSNEELRAVLLTEISRAKRLGRKPYAYFYANWCGPCKALRKSLEDRDPLMLDAFQGTYIIQLDADTWGKKLKGTKFTVEAIPVLFELGKDGKPTGRKIDGGAWGEDIPQNMAPPLKAFFQRASVK